MDYERPVVYIAVGSNIEPEHNLQAAVDLLRTRCEILTISPVFQSPAFGYEDQPDFLDVVIKLTTAREPAAFKTEVLDWIEQRLDRNRNSQISKYGPLTVDIDILLWDTDTFSFGEKPWHVPDKSILKFGAVAIPLAHLAGDLQHPTEGMTLKEIASRFNSKDIHLRTDLNIE